METHTIIADLKAKVEALRNEVAAQRTHMEAWYSVFGTSQLTHAQATMEALRREIAEKDEIIQHLFAFTPFTHAERIDCDLCSKVLVAAKEGKDD